MITDDKLIEWYMKGFNDELNGTSSTESDNEIENRAYRLGAIDALVGDDVRSIDYKTREETLNYIKLTLKNGYKLPKSR